MISVVRLLPDTVNDWVDETVPAQAVAVPVAIPAVRTGAGFTVRVVLAMAEQPSVVPVTEYGPATLTEIELVVSLVLQR